MDEQNFINGELSTDYIDRFKLLDKMNEDAKEQSRKISSAAIAAILLQSEFIKKGRAGISSTSARLQESKWKKK